MSIDLAVAIPTKDSMRTIGLTLDSVEGLAGSVLVVDSGSTDGTVEYCRERGAEVVHRAWQGMVAQRTFLLDTRRDHAWILALDSDESLSEDLRRSIERVVIDDDPAYDGWELNRKVWFMGGWLHHTFQPEWRLRLVRGGKARVEGVGQGGEGGHDRIEVQGRVGRLQGVCRHDSWADVDDMLRRYLELARRAGRFNPSGGRAVNLFFNPTVAFVKQYFLKQGFRDGYRGLLAASAFACGTFMKHALIMQRRLQERVP
jgi:glycosyltransferase involved in cell wall biosynthesis